MSKPFYMYNRLYGISCLIVEGRMHMVTFNRLYIRQSFELWWLIVSLVQYSLLSYIEVFIEH